MDSTETNTTSTANLTSADSRLSAGNIVKITMISVLLVTSLVGNSLVILVITKTKTLRKTINYFILNMAISDIVTPMSILPVWLSWLISNDVGKWYITGGWGTFLCKFLHFCADISPRVSVLSLVFMAVERFYVIVFMRLNMITVRVRCAMLVSTWLIAGGFVATDFYTYQLFDYDTIYCLSSWHPTLSSIHVKIQQPYSLTDHTIFIFLPFILLTTLYSAILITLRRQHNVMRKMCPREGEHQRDIRSRSALKQALAIVIVFGVCFAPYSGVMIVQSLRMNWRASPSLIWTEMVFVVNFLTWLNASINPCMYFIFFSNYRKSLTQMVHGIYALITRKEIQDIHVNSQNIKEERDVSVEMDVLLTGDVKQARQTEESPAADDF